MRVIFCSARSINVDGDNYAVRPASHTTTHPSVISDDDGIR